MKSVLISIQPKWCELIAAGKKTVEVRKTKPKLETPFKVYIYCTNNGGSLHTGYGGLYYHKSNIGKNDCSCINGKVIGEFVCDEITMSFVGYNASGCPSYWDILDGTCLTPNELVCYGEWKTLYGWHISNLVIYDKPKELGEFFQYCGDNPNCDGCEAHYYRNTECGLEDYCCSIVDGCKPLKKPPQSWCYVKTVGNDKEESEQVLVE